MSAGVIFVIGVPLIAIVAFFMQRSPMVVLFSEGEALSRTDSQPALTTLQLMTYQRALLGSEKHRETMMLLSGTVLRHSKHCIDPHCPMCREDTMRALGGSSSNNLQASQKTALSYVKLIYQLARDKYPKYGPLKVAYCIFTLEYVRDTSLAFYCIKQALEEGGLSLWERYVMYCYK